MQPSVINAVVIISKTGKYVLSASVLKLALFTMKKQVTMIPIEENEYIVNPVSEHLIRRNNAE